MGASVLLDSLDALVVELSCVDLHDLRPGTLVRQWELDLSVKTTRTEQGWVKDINSVRSGDNLVISFFLR